MRGVHEEIVESMNTTTNHLFEHNLSMGEYLMRRYKRMARAFSCDARDEQTWRRWAIQAREALHEAMAPWPQPCSLDVLVTERIACEGYMREKVLFRSEQDMCVPAYVLVPTVPPPADANGYPAMICQHGHGHGKDDVVGITHGTLDRWSTRQTLRYDYGLTLVQRGYVVIAMDARGFGERALGYPAGTGEHGCNMVQMKAQLLGLNLLTLNVYDLMRCLDYLHTRPEVDPQRVGCAGLSYGGTLTLFAAALDERIGVAIISGYLGSLWEQTFVRGDTCGQQIIPNLLAWGELADVACLIAPRPLLIESGTEDELFGIEAACRVCSQVERVYATLNVPERMAQNVFEGGHRWDGTRTEGWLARWL